MKRVTPWSNGTEFCMWEAENCDKCRLAPGPEESYDEVECELYRAILDGMTEGDIPIDAARKLGYRHDNVYMGNCTKRLLPGETPDHPDQMFSDFKEGK